MVEHHRNKRLLKKVLGMILSLFALFALLVLVTLYQSDVEFADPNLEAAVLARLDKTRGPVLHSELLQITHLDASGYFITDLDGIEQLHNLEVLNLENNRVQDLQPLEELGRLTELNLRGNRVSDIRPLANLPSLRRLNLRENKVRSLDPLKNLKNLTYLNIHSNTEIRSARPIGRLTRLRTLIMPNVYLGDDVEELRKLKKLRRLNIRNTDIADLSPVIDLVDNGAFSQTTDEGTPVLDLRDNPIDLVLLDGDAEDCAYWVSLSNEMYAYALDACRLDPPTFSHLGGFYTEDFYLVLSHPDPDAVIIYTLDGSEPDINNLGGTTYMYKNQYPQNPGDPFGDTLYHSYRSHLYEKPLFIYDRSPEPDKLTQISTTNHANPRYFPKNPVRKGTPVTARAYKKGYFSSRALCQTYFVFEEGNPYSIPVVSLTIQEDHLFDYYIGVYNAGVDFDRWRAQNPEVDWNCPENRIFNPDRSYNANRRGSEWEVASNIEVFLANSSNPIMNKRVGMRIHGNYSRNFPIKHMRIYARSRYDRSFNKMEMGVFNENVTFAANPNNKRFKRILLRTQSSGGPKLNDVVFNRLMQPVYEGVSRTQLAVHFINGEYWGITTIRDRLDQFHFANHYDIDPDNLIITEGRFHNHEIDVGHPYDMEFFNALERYVFQFENGGKAIDFQRLKDMLCIQSFTDHLILKIYSSNNHYEYGYWRTRYATDNHLGDARWRVYVQDFDRTMWEGNWLDYWSSHIRLFRGLLKNNHFKLYFINRFADHINTTFEFHRFASIINHTYNEAQGYLEEHKHRTNRNFFSRTQKENLVDWAKNHPERQRKMIKQQFNIDKSISVMLNTNNPGYGHIRINTIEIKQGTPSIGKNPYPWSGIYFSGIPIELEAIPQEGYYFAGWQLNGADSMYSTDPLITLSLKDDTSVKAIFRTEQEKVSVLR